MGRLFWKFFFSFWLTLVMAGLTVGTVMWLKQATTDEEQSTRNIVDRRSTAFVSVAADIAEHAGVPALLRYLNQLNNRQLPQVMAVTEQDEDLLGRSVDPEILAKARDPLLPGNRRSVRSIQTPRGELILYSPSTYLAPAFEPPFRHHPPRDRHLPLLLLVVSGLIASVMFSSLLAWYFTRPIRSLKRAFQAVADGDLETRVGPEMGRRKDELAELGQNFDFMTARISQLVQGQKQLLHDVSHELRSPLARMQAAIGIAQQQPDKVDTTLQRLEQETGRVSDLVGELLLLSRMETGEIQRQQGTVALKQLLDDIVANARFEASGKTIHIDYQPGAEVQIQGQQELLHRAIENVVRNAIKFSEAGKEIRVRLSEDTTAGEVKIVVEDQGPGVAETELDNIFRPFFRGEHNQRSDSIGLGLTIARRAVLAHGGHIEAHNLQQGGLQVDLSLPLR